MISLMLDNTTSNMGYWSLKDLEIGFVFTHMYNEELCKMTVDSMVDIFDLLGVNFISIKGEFKEINKSNSLIATALS